MGGLVIVSNSLYIQTLYVVSITMPGVVIPAPPMHCKQQPQTSGLAMRISLGLQSDSLWDTHGTVQLEVVGHWAGISDCPSATKLRTKRHEMHNRLVLAIIFNCVIDRE